jgi:Acetyltransferase (GNAT) domain
MNSPDFHSVFTSDLWTDAGGIAWANEPAYLQSTQYRSPSGCSAQIGINRVSRHRGFLRVQRLGFNELVDESLDEVTIEYNRFRGPQSVPFASSLEWLLSDLERRKDWQEILFSRIAANELKEIQSAAQRRNWGWYLEESRPGFKVAFEKIRSDHGGDFVASLSQNSREQLRRARRFCEKQYGPLKLEIAESEEQALEFLEALAVLHRLRWSSQAHQRGRGFENPAFAAFHKELVRLGTKSRKVEMIKVSAGSSVLAYLYNFRASKEIHFYMSGVNYDLDSKSRAGIIAHNLAIESYLQDETLDAYDFLAGANRYKDSLSNEKYEMFSIVLQRPGFWLTAERALRKLKRRHFPQTGQGEVSQ